MSVLICGGVSVYITDLKNLAVRVFLFWGFFKNCFIFVGFGFLETLCLCVASTVLELTL